MSEKTRWAVVGKAGKVQHLWRSRRLFGVYPHGDNVNHDSMCGLVRTGEEIRPNAYAPKCRNCQRAMKR